MDDVLAFATRLARLGIEINLCGKRENRLWFWPKDAFDELPRADRAFIDTHKAELKELVRSGRAPRLDDLKAELLKCPYCQRACVGQDHPAYDVLHSTDPEVVARKDRAATEQMLLMMPYSRR